VETPIETGNVLVNEALTLQSIKKDDDVFLYELYASTRIEEMALTGWPAQQIDWFLQMQFNLQHNQWQENYPDAAFDLILMKGQPVGRLYVDHQVVEIRVIDIAILPEFRGQGIGTYCLKQLIEEAKNVNKKLSLHVERNNPAMKLYQRLGFKVVNQGEVYFLMEIQP
jgi:ribosomal protein S18 acetylase RimI-like enzyme